MARQPQPNERNSEVSCHGEHLSARPARTGQALSQQLCHPAGPQVSASQGATLKLRDMRMVMMARQPRPIHSGPEFSLYEGHS